MKIFRQPRICKEFKLIFQKLKQNHPIQMKGVGHDDHDEVKFAANGPFRNNY